jgi:hypothetical protein
MFDETDFYLRLGRESLGMVYNFPKNNLASKTE